jgi:hypothetical protein
MKEFLWYMVGVMSILCILSIACKVDAFKAYLITVVSGI